MLVAYDHTYVTADIEQPDAPQERPVRLRVPAALSAAAADRVFVARKLGWGKS